MIGSTARFRICGRFEGACAWDLAARIEKEPLGELRLDFSQCAEFVDYGIAVLASALLSIPDKVVHLEGLRQHHLRLFKYFGVDVDKIEHRPPHPAGFSDDDLALSTGVA
ncbi:MAG: STAS domain-containing protein [Myxococcales bacterium]